MEAVILVLVATIGGCFLVQIFQARPDAAGVVSGSAAQPCRRVPCSWRSASWERRSCRTTFTSTRRWCRRGGSAATAAAGRRPAGIILLDSTIALNAAFFVNAAILVLSAAVFHRHGVEVATIEEAHRLLPSFLGKAAPILFGVALLVPGRARR